MRPIDADAVLDRYYAEYERQDICDGAEDREWLMKCLNEAPTLTPPNEWVSVDERLPEEKQRVIVRCERVGTSVGWILWGNWMTDIGPGAGKVTHWVPLPAPPGKGNNVPTDESLTLEQLRASPHGKIKDSTLQSICNRANDIACRPPEGEA